MPYIDTLGDICRVTMAAIYGPQVQENNINYVCTNSGGSDSRPALLSAVVSAYNSIYRPVMSPDASLYGAKAAVINRPPPPMASTFISMAPGTASLRSMPTQARPVLKTVTQSAGPRYRGRLYVFTPEESFMSGTFLPSTTLRTALNNLGLALFIPITVSGTTWSPCIAHRNPGPPVSWSFTLILGSMPSNEFGTQRKSGNYGRTNGIPF